MMRRMRRLKCTVWCMVWISAALLSMPRRAGAQSALVVEHVTLIDGRGGAPVAGVTIVVEGDRFAAVGQNVDGPEGARRIDAAGKYAIPGLMDMHVHLRGGVRALHGYLYSGVTAIYDAGNDPDVIFTLRERERRGELVAPRIFATGSVVTAPGGHGGGRGVTVEDFARDRAKLDAHIARAPDLLKITQDEHGWGTRPLIRHMPVDLLEQVIRYYHEHGIRTTIHISNELRAWDAIYASIDTLAHPVIQAPVSERYLNMMSVKKDPAGVDAHDRRWLRPSRGPPGVLSNSLSTAPRCCRPISSGFVTTTRRRVGRAAVDAVDESDDAGGAGELEDDSTRLAAWSLLGTDQSLGPAVHRELELLVAGGIELAIDAIRMGTLERRDLSR